MVDHEHSRSVIVGDVSGVSKHLVGNVNAEFREECSLGRSGKYTALKFYFFKLFSWFVFYLMIDSLFKIQDLHHPSIYKLMKLCHQEENCQNKKVLEEIAALCGLSRYDSFVSFFNVHRLCHFASVSRLFVLFLAFPYLSRMAFTSCLI